MSQESDETDNWAKLTPDLVRNIAARLQPNEAAISLTVLNRDTAAALQGIASFTTIFLPSFKPIATRPKLRVACRDTPWPGNAFVEHWGRPEPWRSLGLPQRLRLLCLAASSRHAASLDAALAHSGVGLACTVLEAAAAVGDAAACRRLLLEGCDSAPSALAAAAACGHLHLLQWAWHENLSYKDSCSPSPGPGSGSGSGSGTGRKTQLQPPLSLRQAFGWRPEVMGELAVAAAGGGQGYVLTRLEGLVWPPAHPPLLPLLPQLPTQLPQPQNCLSCAVRSVDGGSGGGGGGGGRQRRPVAAGGGQQPQHQHHHSWSWCGRRVSEADGWAQARRSVARAFLPMALAAATHGHVTLLDRLLLLQPPSQHQQHQQQHQQQQHQQQQGSQCYYADQLAGLSPGDYGALLCGMAAGCPAAALQHHHSAWVPHRTSPPDDKLLLQALRGTSPDWRATCDFLLAQARQAAGGAAAGVAGGTVAEMVGAGQQAMVAEGPQAGRGMRAESGEETAEARLARAAVYELEHYGCVSGWESAADPDFPQRVRYLMDLGVLPSGEWEPNVATALAAAGNTAALRQLLDEWGDAGAEYAAEVAEAAVLRGRLEVMQLLRERFGPGIFTAGDLKAAAGLGHFQALRYLITLWRDTEGAAAESGGEAPSWDQVFGLAARSGAGVELLRLLHEGCGAVVDLGAVAAGGGEAALEWAVGELRAAGQDAARLTPDQVYHMAACGNLATATWVLNQPPGLLLVPPPSQSSPLPPPPPSAPASRCSGCGPLPHPADVVMEADEAEYEDDVEWGRPRLSNSVRLWALWARTAAAPRGAGGAARAGAAGTHAGARRRQEAEWTFEEEEEEEKGGKQKQMQAEGKHEAEVLEGQAGEAGGEWARLEAFTAYYVDSRWVRWSAHQQAWLGRQAAGREGGG